MNLLSTDMYWKRDGAKLRAHFVGPPIRWDWDKPYNEFVLHGHAWSSPKYPWLQIMD